MGLYSVTSTKKPDIATILSSVNILLNNKQILKSKIFYTLFTLWNFQFSYLNVKLLKKSSPEPYPKNKNLRKHTLD